jgi:hypothetical protein
MREARRGFCGQGTRLIEFYVFCGTKRLKYQSQIKVRRFYLKALAGGAPMSQRSGDWGRGALITYQSIVMDAENKMQKP